MSIVSVTLRHKSTTIVLAALLFLVGPGVDSCVTAQEDVADVRSKEYRLDGAGRQRYLLIGAKGTLKTRAGGFKLLVVLPGGDGGPDFEPFVKRIYKHVLSDEYLVIQLIAPKWKTRQITWPTEGNPVRGMTVSVEEFLAEAVESVRKRTKIDRRHIFTLSWSSGGPAAYAASLSQDTPITGSLVAMSVFEPKQLPDLTRAKGKHYYILHSPEDRVCPYRMAQAARDQLGRHGAIVQLAEYAGGHGWRGNVFGNIRAGIAWLEEQTKQIAMGGAGP